MASKPASSYALRLWRVGISEITVRTPASFKYSISASRRSGRWLRPPPPGRSSAHSLRGRAHQIRFGSVIPTPFVVRRLKRRDDRLFAPPLMCRVFGCVAADPVTVRHDLLEADNPLIRQSEEHDSGWGMSVYKRADGQSPRCLRLAEAAFEDAEFVEATAVRGRIFNVHVRRATMGGLTEENTHPFCLGPYSFCHNGTIMRYPKLLDRDVAKPKGQTDSEAFFNFLMRDFDDGHPRRCLRTAVRKMIERTPFSGINFLFSDGEKLYAYKLGIFELHWAARDGSLAVASEKITKGDAWHSVQDDVLLTLDPRHLDAAHAERLIGDDWVKRAEIVELEDGKHLRGVERGDFARARAEKLAAESA